MIALTPTTKTHSINSNLSTIQIFPNFILGFVLLRSRPSVIRTQKPSKVIGRDQSKVQEASLTRSRKQVPLSQDHAQELAQNNFIYISPQEDGNWTELAIWKKNL